MTNRKRIAVLTASVFAVSAVGIGVAVAAKGFFFKHAIERVKRKLELTPEQTTKFDALKERVIASFKQSKGNHKALHAEAKALWLGDTLDPAALDALHGKMKAAHEARAQIVKGAIVELHQLLTPAQRQKLVKVIEKFRSKMKKHFKHGGAPF